MGVTSMTYIVAMIVLYGTNTKGMDPCADAGDDRCPGNFTWSLPGGVPAMFKVLSLYSFAYSCTQNMPSLVYELKNRTQAKCDVCIWSAIGFSTVFYIIGAYFGYKAFGDYVKSDLLVTIPRSDPATVARIAVIANLLTTFPLQ
eukprot:UN23648